MKNTYSGFYRSLGKYSLWAGLFGVFSYFAFFPDGIYYSFFFGAMTIAMALISKKNYRSRISSIAMVFGFIDILIAALAFFSLYTIYSLALDPVLGPYITNSLKEAFSSYGIPLSVFVDLINH